MAFENSSEPFPKRFNRVFESSISLFFNLVLILYPIFWEEKIFLRIDRIFEEQVPDPFFGFLAFSSLILDSAGLFIKARSSNGTIFQLRGPLEPFLKILLWLFHFILSLLVLILGALFLKIPFDDWLFILLATLNCFKEVYLFVLLNLPPKPSPGHKTLRAVIGELFLFFSGTIFISFTWDYISWHINFRNASPGERLIEGFLFSLLFVTIFLGARFLNFLEDFKRRGKKTERLLFYITLLGATIGAVWSIF